MFGFVNKNMAAMPRLFARRTAINVASVRGVATMGKHFAQLRREEAAKKAAEKAERLAYHAAKQAAVPPKVEDPAIVDAKQRINLITRLDSFNPNVQVPVMQEIITKEHNWLNRELSQIIALCQNSPKETWKYALQVFDKIVKADYVPERAAFRCMIRILEDAEQYKAALLIGDFLLDVYPRRQFDISGRPLPHVVLQNPIPDVTTYANIPESENTFETLEKYIMWRRNDDARKAHYPTHYKFMEGLMERGRYDEAASELFGIFHDIGCCDTADVPAPYTPILIHHVYRNSNSAHKTNYPLYYSIIEYLESIGNYSAAMQAYIYMRSLNRNIDVTLSRETNGIGNIRDFADLHSFKHFEIKFIIKQWLKELRLRRGFYHAVEAKAAGVEGAKTYLRPEPREAGMVDRSPLINTTIEQMLILADRSYNNKDVRDETPAEEINADFIVNEFAEYGIKAEIVKESPFMSSYYYLQARLEKDMTYIDDVKRELIVMVSPEELDNYAERALAKLKTQFPAKN